MAEHNNRPAESAGQDQTARMCRLILPCTLSKNKSMVVYKTKKVKKTSEAVVRLFL